MSRAEYLMYSLQWLHHYLEPGSTRLSLLKTLQPKSEGCPVTAWLVQDTAHRVRCFRTLQESNKWWLSALTAAMGQYFGLKWYPILKLLPEIRICWPNISLIPTQTLICGFLMVFSQSVSMSVFDGWNFLTLATFSFWPALAFYSQSSWTMWSNITLKAFLDTIILMAQYFLMYWYVFVCKLRTFMCTCTWAFSMHTHFHFCKSP